MPRSSDAICSLIRVGFSTGGTIHLVINNQVCAVSCERLLRNPSIASNPSQHEAGALGLHRIGAV